MDTIVYLIKNKDGKYSTGGTEENINWTKNGKLFRKIDIFHHFNDLKNPEETYKDCIIEVYTLNKAKIFKPDFLNYQFKEFINKKQEKLKQRYIPNV